MSKEKALPTSSLFGEIFHVGLYKGSQGKVTRQVTCATLWVTVALACYQLYTSLYAYDVWQFVIPGVLLVAGFWAAYRLVNYPRFADFLIAVEAEMTKVSWPSQGELVRSSIVVIVVLVVLAVVLYGYDLLWWFLFADVIGILKP